MKGLKGSVMINVPAEKAWTVLKDFASYPQWNSFLTQMKGELREGSMIDVTVSVPDRKDTKFRSKVIKVDQGKEFRTKGAIKKGLLTSEHLFLIEPLGEAQCMFTQNIRLTGLLSYLIGGMVRDLQKGLIKMNEETKKLCEKK